jgi:putative ABC transport system ATP-binding protein
MTQPPLISPISSPPAIQLSRIQKSFGEGETRLQVLFDIDLPIQSGELTLIVGPSGCGKTTLISIIAGILNADSGAINLFGTRLDVLTDTQKTDFRKKNVGFIFQQFNLLPTLTVQENVAVPLMISGVPKDLAMEKALPVLEQVDLLTRKDFLPVNLSGGQQQRVAIGRALIREPNLIICDEPTASLDGGTGQKVMALLREVAVQPGRCVIVVTHDNRIYPYGDRMVEMEDGRIQGIKQMSQE